MSIASENPSLAAKPSDKNEALKAASNSLRGHILQDIEDNSTSTVTEESAQLLRFRGIYPQDDSDLRKQRREEGQEKAFIFMANCTFGIGLRNSKRFTPRG
jgi:sulfite reductase beta subunit-like hemoprotein